MKRIITLLVAAIIGGSIYYQANHPQAYYALKTGTIVDKYRTNLTENKYSHEELIFMVKYAEGIERESVDATTYYGNKSGDTVTFNKQTSENPWWIGSIMFSCAVGILYIVYLIEDPGPPDYYTRMTNAGKKDKPDFGL